MRRPDKYCCNLSIAVDVGFLWWKTDIGEEHNLAEQHPEAVERLLDLTMPLYKKTVLKKKVVSLKLF